LFLGKLRNGLFLTRDDVTASYAIIRHNIRTYRSAGVVAGVRGKQSAESELKKFEDSQDSSDRREGWRYFIEKTDLKAETDPAEANPTSPSRIGRARIESSAGDKDSERSFAKSSEMRRGV
jgi:hypothetical protein